MSVSAERLQRLRTLMRRVPGLAVMVRAGRVLFDPAFRKDWRFRRLAGDQLFQPANLTWDNRYPQIFAFLGHVLASRARPRIVSFGCSSGEEVFSLARYFPAAEIVGIDINPDNVKACQQALLDQPNPLIQFRQGADLETEAPESVDAIFCMAVLRHGDLAAHMPDRCDPVLQFQDFARIIAGFERSLKPGGFLALWHCHFRLDDADPQQRFAAVMKLPAVQGDPVYDRDNRRTARRSFEDAVFQKRASG